MKNTIDALALKKAFIAGANNLDNKKDYINELNVFPVRDRSPENTILQSVSPYYFSQSSTGTAI